MLLYKKTIDGWRSNTFAYRHRLQPALLSAHGTKNKIKFLITKESAKFKHRHDARDVVGMTGRMSTTTTEIHDRYRDDRDRDVRRAPSNERDNDGIITAGNTAQAFSGYANVTTQAVRIEPAD